MENNKISVKTTLGNLTACIGGDPEEYPEIFIYLTLDDGTEIDLVAAEVCPSERSVKAYLWGDTMTDEWTRSHIWSEDEILQTVYEE